MRLLFATMLPETPNTETFGSEVVGNTRGVHAMNGTGEHSCTRLTLKQVNTKSVHEVCTTAAGGIRY